MQLNTVIKNDSRQMTLCVIHISHFKYGISETNLKLLLIKHLSTWLYVEFYLHNGISTVYVGMTVL